MEYIALFFTHSGALKYDKFLKEKGIKSTLTPVPRKLSSSCGVGTIFVYSGNIEEFISEDIDKIFKVEKNEYSLVYSSDE